jgi:hypothetical protein
MNETISTRTGHLAMFEIVSAALPTPKSPPATRAQGGRGGWSSGRAELDYRLRIPAWLGVQREAQRLRRQRVPGAFERCDAVTCVGRRTST